MATITDPVHFAILSFWSIFVILDPVGAVPTFLAMTEGDRPQARVVTYPPSADVIVRVRKKPSTHTIA